MILGLRQEEINNKFIWKGWNKMYKNYLNLLWLVSQVLELKSHYQVIIYTMEIKMGIFKLLKKGNLKFSK